jgi:iron complex outermembrane receptor protein
MRTGETAIRPGEITTRVQALSALALLAALAIIMVWQAGGAAAQSVEQLQRYSIEDLSNVEITSVSRRPEPLRDAAASIYVITNEDIHRSGAVSLPEALRLAPNLEVMRLTATTYVISARGFAGAAASNKLLVLIDGRSVYSPLYSGVFWDQQQVMLADIERIEVISGPGGTLWGANAVNGVINIITKNSRDTQGVLVDLQAGLVDQSGNVRYGGRFGETGSYRVYGTGMGIGFTDTPGGHSADDGWRAAQTGFRTDWGRDSDAYDLQGDFYRNTDSMNGRQYGGDIQGRWQRALADGANLQVQTSFDEEQRVVVGTSDTTRNFDLQAQHTATLGRNLIVWGGEYRVIQDDYIQAALPTLIPSSQVLGIGDLFAQDTIVLTNSVKLTFGSKFEDSTYTGFDVLPSIRLGWRVNDTAFLWAAISRAVRTPARIDRDLQAPGILLPAPDFETEKLIAYEVGYRGKPTASTSLSVSFYYDVYSDLRTLTSVGSSVLPLQLSNDRAGYAAGVEVWGDWNVLPWWRLSAGANFLHKDFHLKEHVADQLVPPSDGNDPGYQLSFRSSMDLIHNVTLDFGARAIANLIDPALPSYIEGDARIAWHVTPALEVSLTGANLFAPTQAEQPVAPGVVYAERRSVYLGLTWKY